MRGLLIAAMCFGLVIPASPIAAHSGGLNSEGCHNNRKTGDYHCHGGGGSNRKPTRAIGLYGGDGGNDNYSSCAEARAAGAAPLRRGQRGYSIRLDRDGDGVACE